MVVLAATVVISLSSNNIVGKANQAVDTTNEKSIQQAAILLWADAYAGGARTQSDLEDAVLDGLEEIENLDLDDYTVTVTETGVTVEKAVILTPSERYYGVANVVPTNLEYFTYDNYDATNKTVTLTGVKSDYAQTSYYVWLSHSDPYTSAIIAEDGTVITDVVIPYEMTDENGDTYTVTAIGNRAFGAAMDDGYAQITTNYTSFILPSTITSIGDHAFYKSSGLTSVTIGDSVTSIGRCAFGNCPLTSVVFKNTSGWSANNTSIDVSDAANAATYLTSTYKDYTWTRSDAE